MNTRWSIIVLAASMATAAAQERMAESLRKGIVEEESKHNLNAAIQDYQAALTQFDEARTTAATALFRMAECYRREGKNDEAIAAYKRVVQEFADQSKLAEQSRAVLSGAYHVAEPFSSPVADQARQQYRQTLVEEVSLRQQALARYQQLRRSDVIPAQEVEAARMALLEAQGRLAAFDAGILPCAPASGKK
jgi:tetratricopeptide (TPR) repeat protein